MLLRDLRQLTPAQHQERWRRALAAHDFRDVPEFPHLAHWNYGPCPQHAAAGTQNGCQDCGGSFRRHQRTAVTWLYLALRGLISDPTGSGKTLIALGLLALLRESGELGHEPGRARAVVVAGAATQWLREFRRFCCGFEAIAVTGTPDQRAAKYVLPWDVAFITPETLRMRQIKRSTGTVWAGDLELLQDFRPGIVIYDDVDPMRHQGNKTAAAVSKLAETAFRVVGIHATPLQKRPTELHSFLVPLGGLQILGPLSVFEHQFVKYETVYTEQRDPYGRSVIRGTRREAGIRNGPQLKRLVGPLVLRRTPEDIDDLEMPALVHNVVWLEPSPAQRQRYAEVRKGVVRKIREEGESVTHAAAMALFMHAWQVCSGLASLDGATGSAASVKLDWAEYKITGDMAQDKVVVFINFTPNVEEFSRRLTAAGVGHVIQWGRESSKRVREERLDQWRSDPSCRVLIGTTSIERSLNLQAARHLIAADTIINPARMTQLAGRVKRAGSAFPTVYIHQLLLKDTMEESFPAILAREQALADYVWDEQGAMFQGLSPLAILQLVSGDPELTARLARA